MMAFTFSLRFWKIRNTDEGKRHEEDSKMTVGLSLLFKFTEAKFVKGVLRNVKDQ